MNQANETIIHLAFPTVFPDLNRAESKSEDYARDTLKVERLKFKHFKKMQSMSDAEQMQYAICALTGLSETDLDELDAEDAAEITGVIYGYMQKYLDLAKKMMRDNTN